MTTLSVALQVPKPCDRRATQCLRTEREAVPGNPPTFSPAQLSLPPFYPKWLEFPITIPAFLQEGVAKVPYPSATSHCCCTMSHTPGFTKNCCWVGKGRSPVACAAFPARCGWDRAASHPFLFCFTALLFLIKSFLFLFDEVR